MKKIIFISIVWFMFGGMLISSCFALSGDPLYPVKLHIEDLRLALSSDAADIELYRGFGVERVGEMKLLVAASRYSDAVNTASLFKETMNKLVVLLESDDVGEQPDWMVSLIDDYLQVSRQILDAPRTGDIAFEQVRAAFTANQDEVVSLFASFFENTQQNNLANQLSDSGYPAPATLTAQPTTVYVSTITPQTITPTLITPMTHTPTAVLPSSTATVMPTNVYIWPTWTPTKIPPTAEPTDSPTSLPTAVPTTQPTNSAYPPPVTPTEQPTNPGYPAPVTPTAGPTEPGYPPPNPTSTPSSTSTPTLTSTSTSTTTPTLTSTPLPVDTEIPPTAPIGTANP